MVGGRGESLPSRCAGLQAQEHRVPCLTAIKHLLAFSIQLWAGLGTEGPPSHKPCLEVPVATGPLNTASPWGMAVSTGRFLKTAA